DLLLVVVDVRRRWPASGGGVPVVVFSSPLGFLFLTARVVVFSSPLRFFFLARVCAPGLPVDCAWCLRVGVQAARCE
ncbi:hypothetical protein Dimus_005694, partial [Dionaea muscipula]